MTAAEWAQRLEHDAIWAQAGREDNGLRFRPDIDEIIALTVAEARQLAALLRRAERVEAAARDALAAMINTLALCENQHHPKRDRNHEGDCPPVARFNVAQEALREALEEKP